MVPDATIRSAVSAAAPAAAVHRLWGTLRLPLHPQSTAVLQRPHQSRLVPLHPHQLHHHHYYHRRHHHLLLNLLLCSTLDPWQSSKHVSNTQSFNRTKACDFQLNNCIHSHVILDLATNYTYILSSVETSFGSKCVKSKGSVLWNNKLPRRLTDISSHAIFKYKLKE